MFDISIDRDAHYIGFTMSLIPIITAENYNKMYFKLGLINTNMNSVLKLFSPLFPSHKLYQFQVHYPFSFSGLIYIYKLTYMAIPFSISNTFLCL